jgi:hypothetical protein
MLRSLLVGLFVEHVAGVLEDGTIDAATVPDGGTDTPSPALADAPAAFRLRADEVADILERGVPHDEFS